MIHILEDILPYISGLYTLPWILVGFIVTILIAKVTGREKIDKLMKKISLILLYCFIPVLLFRIFLNTDFGQEQMVFSLLVTCIIVFMYLLAYGYGRYQAKKQHLRAPRRNLYLKTVLTNQGRSSAFIGSAMMAYWNVEAGIFMAFVGIGLFAVIPYLLAHMHRQEQKHTEKQEQKTALPFFLKLYPWYLIAFVIAAVLLHSQTGVTTSDFGDLGIILHFYTALTIPAALYYVGASIHPSDLKVSEMKKLFGMDTTGEKKEHWSWVRTIFFLTVVLTPLCVIVIFTPLYLLSLIPGSWFAVIVINAILPITSTNMFLLPYGIDKKSTAHVVTWTTLVCVPLVVALIILFNLVLP